MISHDVEFAAENADEIILLDKGEIIDQGSKYEILSNSTFYSPQVSKLFNNIIDNIVTFDQAKQILEEIEAYDMHN